MQKQQPTVCQVQPLALELRNRLRNGGHNCS
jgi:hypothetical protein